MRSCGWSWGIGLRVRLLWAGCMMTVVLLGGAMVGLGQGAETPLHTASRNELDVVKVVLAQEKAWNAGDIQGYVDGYKNSPDTIFMGKSISKGYAEILEDYKRNYATRGAMGTLAFSELEVHPLNDKFMVCLGKYHLDRTKRDGGNADGVFSLVVEKTDAGWKIVLDHTT
jgi:ketosteroid isomerase-like protein